MKWFKHDTNAGNNVKIARLINLYGYEGYGIYFRLLELIASPIESTNISEWGTLNSLYNDEYLALNVFKMDLNRFKLIKKTMIKLGLFLQNRGKISCPELLTRLDEYAEKAKKKLSNGHSYDVGTMSGQSRDAIGIKSCLKEENRKEKNRIDKTGKHSEQSSGSNEPSDLKTPREILKDRISKKGIL